MVNAGTFRIAATRVGHLTGVFTIGRAFHVKTGGRRRTVAVSVEANVRIVTARLTGLCKRIPDQLGRTAAAVATRNVVTKSRVVTGMSCALVNVYTLQSSLVFVATVTFTRRLTISHNAGAVRTAIDVIAGTLTNEIDAIFR